MANGPDIPRLLWLGLLMAGSGLPAQAWINSVYTLNGGTANLTNQTYVATNVNQSAVYVLGKGKLTLVNPTITTSGNTTNSDASSFYGLNAAVLASTNSSIAITGGSVTTTGTGANGVFATGSGAVATLNNVTINCSGQLGHGVDATFGGTVNVTNCTIATTKANGSVLATDRGGGYVNVSGGTYSAAGQDSAGVYSTGIITVNNATVYSTGGEAIVVEGANSAIMTNCTMSGVKGTRDRGIFIYQSMSGDAEGYLGSVTLVGGSYTWPSTTGPAFYLTNTKGIVFLKDVAITNKSPILLKCSTNQWGTAGANGGTAAFTVEGVDLTGAVLCDSYSTNFLTLRSNSTLTGYINKSSLSLDATSTWIVTSNSALTSLTNAGTITGSYPVTNLSTIWLSGGVISAMLVGSNGLAKTSANTAVLSGANTYSGPTLVSGGELIISTRFAGKGNFTVTNGATLGVTNQFAGTSASISNLTVGTGTTLEFINVSDLTTAPVTVSNLVVLGTNTIKITGAENLTGGSTYPLISYAGSFSGSFSNLRLEMPASLTGTLVSTAHGISLTMGSSSTPATPTGLAAVAGDSQVALTWNASTDATGYNVWRSTTSGGPYTVVAGGITSVAYTTTGLLNGTNYYFVVSATNGSGESGYSAQVSARPVSSVAPQLEFTVSSGSFQFSWPASHVGWKLQAQTNSLSSGLGSNWVDVPGSEDVDQMSIPIGVSNGAVFFRLISP